MAKPNYSFEKRQRELEKKRKQEEKRLRKQVDKGPVEVSNGDVPPTGVSRDSETDPQK